ncbi:MAG: PASTA domain-containing protein [Solirubrobacterales bacterium]
MPEIGEGSVVDGRYRLLRRIGSGGMADVWLAEDPHLQRRVALKILHPRFAQDTEFIERFRREAEAAAGLQHPNIVAVFDRGEYEGAYYIAMQYVAGRSLKAAIDAGLTPPEAVALVRQVLEAARFAHRHGVVHRDLKPHNVIVDAEGKAMVTDFGIARAGASEVTQVGVVMGTPHYISPEQAQGTEITASSDLYSIGVMLYEALAGRVPFDGDSSVAVAMKQVTQTPQVPSTFNKRVSPALDAVAMRALKKEPAERFQNADAFIAALDEAMLTPGAPGGGTAVFAPLPPAAPLPENPDLEAEEERRNRRVAWLLVLAAVLFGALVGLALTRDTSTPVPAVTGNQLNVAIALLQQEGFSIAGVERVRRQAPADTVLEQDPAASPPARQASMDCAFLTFFCSKPKVTLTVSAGPGRVKVPSTTGLSAADAVAKLKHQGLKPKVKSVHSATVEAGLVVHSQPPAGTRPTRGSTVTLFVSAGPKLNKVPVLVGTQRSVAVQQLRGRGFVPSVSEKRNSAPAGEVVQQSPNAGKLLPPGSTVALVVSKGKAKKTEEQKATVPNVIGKERAAAVETVRAAGLQPTVQEQETEVPSQVGRVTDQFPPPGLEVAPGTSVTLIVGKPARSSAPESTAPESTPPEAAPVG